VDTGQYLSLAHSVQLSQEHVHVYCIPKLASVTYYQILWKLHYSAFGSLKHKIQFAMHP